MASFEKFKLTVQTETLKKYIFPVATLLVILYTRIYWWVTFSNFDDFLDAKEAFYNHFGLSSEYSIYFPLALIALLLASFIYTGQKINAKIPQIIFVVLHSLLLLLAIWELM
ncbi:hypothetical protein [Nonlabens antarcticus]|uniref:hypothetical protein n=1 Tax=Nonlabens antarcticus TaxID=392714 RepID=UPI001890BAC5|nr:hypothetical protein [Nonlabens antarcticus]